MNFAAVCVFFLVLPALASCECYELYGDGGVEPPRFKKLNQVLRKEFRSSPKMRRANWTDNCGMIKQAKVRLHELLAKNETYQPRQEWYNRSVYAIDSVPTLNLSKLASTFVTRHARGIQLRLIYRFGMKREFNGSKPMIKFGCAADVYHDNNRYNRFTVCLFRPVTGRL